MKTTRVFRIAAALALGLGQITGRSQTYHYSGPVDGYTEVDLSPGGFGTGGFVADFGTINETLYYNPVAQTLQQVGSITVIPSSGSFNITGSSFTELGSGTATLTVGNHGSFSFDVESALDEGINLLVPVSGFGIFNGQPFSGEWDIVIPMAAQLDSVSPTSLLFDDSTFMGAPYAGAGPGLGLEDGCSDGTYYCGFDLGVAEATAVPEESNTLSLIGFGLSVLTFLRRR
jgi:hypothetical protein